MRWPVGWKACKEDLEAKFAHGEEKMAAEGMLDCGGDNSALAETIGRSWRLPSSALSLVFNLSPPIPLELFLKNVQFWGLTKRKSRVNCFWMVMEFNALWTKRTALGWAGLALIWTATTAQAQLFINIYPSQDNPDSETIWIFSGSPRGFTAHYSSSIRSSGNYHARDSWKVRHGIGYTLYRVNNPSNQLSNLSPLFSSTNTIDIESIESRLSGSSRATSPFYSGLTFSADSTNAPTISAGSASKTIGSIFMNDAAQDEIGIRGTAGNSLVYNTNGQRIDWFGSGILDKPIGDFIDVQGHLRVGRDSSTFWNALGVPYFAPRRNSEIGISFSHRVIPETEEYAFVFGLFALAFVIVRRHFQKKELRNRR